MIPPCLPPCRTQGKKLIVDPRLDKKASARTMSRAVEVKPIPTGDGELIGEHNGENSKMHEI